MTAPLPYSAGKIRSQNGVKNSAGGDEPESSSPIAGARKKSTSAGGIFGRFMN
jgi:hypothetical protein